MAIKILKSTDPVTISTLIQLVYGDPGAGKTSLAFTANKPLALDFDRGVHRSGYRKDAVEVESWADIAGLTEHDLAGYDTIIVDTVGRCLDVLAAEIIRDNPKLGNKSGALTLQGYGALKSGFAAWLKKIRSFGKDVVLVAHAVESRDGDSLIVRPDITGGSYAEIFKVADGVAYLHMSDKQRVLEFNPTDRYVGKNPAALDTVKVPNFSEESDFLASLIEQTKHAMGALSAEAQAVVQIVGDWRQSIDSVADAAGMNNLLADVNGIESATAQAQIKALMAKRCKDIDVQWDAKQKAFVAIKEAA